MGTKNETSVTDLDRSVLNRSASNSSVLNRRVVRSRISASAGRRLAALSLVLGFVLVAACAPPAPPVGPAPAPPTAPTTTIAPPAPPAPPPAAPTTTIAPPAPAPALTSLYALSGHSALSTYTITFFNDMPQNVRDSMWRATAAVHDLSGITFAPGTVSTGEVPAHGEIRVRIGTLCSEVTSNEAGCAATWTSLGRLSRSDISVTARTRDSIYLDQVLLHEVGHAVGLKHVDFHPAAPQIMNPVVNWGVNEFQAGDREGLRLTGLNKYDPNAMTGFALQMAPAKIDVHAVFVGEGALACD